MQKGNCHRLNELVICSFSEIKVHRERTSLKIRIPNPLIIVNVLDILLAASIFLIPLAPVRFILGLPLLLFFPGYALLQALFINKKEIGALETIGLSGAMSIAVTGMTGFMLNYTKWGIRFEPAVGLIGGFVFVASVVALVRQAVSSGGVKWFTELIINQPAWKIPSNKGIGFLALTVTLLVSIVAVAYAAVDLKAKETFTEFYVLGINGKADDYPTAFTMESGNVTRVIYTAGNETAGQWGKVYLNIVNHESSTAVYSIYISVDGQPAEFIYGGTPNYQLGNIQLRQGEKWEGEIGFTPAHIGNHQKVDFLLFKDGGTDPEASLNLWISAIAPTP